MVYSLLCSQEKRYIATQMSGLRVTVDLTMEVEGCKFGAYCFNDNCSGLSEYHQIREELITQAFERLEKNIEWFASEKYMQLTREEVARTLAGAEQQYNVAKWLQDFKKNQ